MPEQRPIPSQSLASALISFGRLLKDNGFSVSVPAVMDALEGVSKIGVEEIEDFRTVLQATFLSRVEEYAAFDRLFTEFWLGGEKRGQGPETDSESAPGAGRGAPPDTADDIIAEAGISDSQERHAWQARPYVIYSPREVLRDKDFKEIPSDDDPRMARLIKEILAPLTRRVGVRKRPVRDGSEVDFRRLLRNNLRYGGEIYELPRLKPKRRIKRLVFLCDVSGSMDPYLRFMLRFIKEIQEVRTRVETLVFSTRLHRITPLLRHLPFARAMEEVSPTVKEWSGGTRIGACLAEFTSFRGGAMLGPSTVVLIHSDGWDRGDAVLLEREMSKIQRRCHRVLWMNPLLGGPGYEPSCRGMKTALPYVDLFLPGHNVSALERLARFLTVLL